MSVSVSVSVSVTTKFRNEETLGRFSDVKMLVIGSNIGSSLFCVR